jgi:hypothetical protein
MQRSFRQQEAILAERCWLASERSTGRARLIADEALEVIAGGAK